MPRCLSSIICLPLDGSGRRAQGQPTGTRRIPHSPTVTIHTLNDDVLLNVFYLYQLDFLDKYHEDGWPYIHRGGQRWWYKLVQVCQWWRYLMLASPSQLNLHLLCTNGVHIANMLAHSPRLPLTINYYNTPREDSDASEGILLALRHSDRVHYICLDLLRLVAPLRVAELRVAKLREIITTMDGQFPILERLYILSSDEDVVLPRTFQAPHLRHLYLWGAALPIGSPLLTTTVGLVTLILRDIPLSAYFPPNYLLTRLSLMPQLEIVQISFRWPRQLLDTPIVTHITLPNLRRFVFGGVSAYLEGLLAQIIAPVLSELYIELFYQLPFTVSHFSRLMGTSKILIFSVVMLTFSHNYVSLRSFQPGKKDNPPFRMTIKYIHDRQVTVASAVQVLTTLQPVLSIVEQLILSSQSSEWDNEVDRTLWRQLLRPFSNLKTLHVQYSLVGKLACSLQTDDGEPPLELLPNLKEVGYSGDYARDVFTPFINEREVAGHPVNLTMVDHSVFWWS